MVSLTAARTFIGNPEQESYRLANHSTAYRRRSGKLLKCSVIFIVKIRNKYHIGACKGQAYVNINTNVLVFTENETYNTLLIAYFSKECFYKRSKVKLPKHRRINVRFIDVRGPHHKCAGQEFEF